MRFVDFDYVSVFGADGHEADNKSRQGYTLSLSDSDRGSRMAINRNIKNLQEDIKKYRGFFGIVSDRLHMETADTAIDLKAAKREAPANYSAYCKLVERREDLFRELRRL